MACKHCIIHLRINFYNSSYVSVSVERFQGLPLNLTQIGSALPF